MYSVPEQMQCSWRTFIIYLRGGALDIYNLSKSHAQEEVEHVEILDYIVQACDEKGIAAYSCL